MNVEQFAEIKGYLCGFVCTGRESEGQLWLETLAGGLHLFDFDVSTQRDTLIELYKEVSNEMENQELGLKQTIFEKSLPVKTRAYVLQKWCQGFMAGLMQSGLPLRQIEINTELSQTFKQFQDISALNIESLDISDADEAIMASMVGFIEQAVFHIYQTFMQQKTKH